MLDVDIWLSFRDFNSWSFETFYVEQETDGANLLDQHCYPDNFK